MQLSASLLWLPAELHHVLAACLEMELAGCQVPDLTAISALSRTCSALYDRVAWILFEACRMHSILAKRAIQHALDHSKPELLERLVDSGVSLDVDFFSALECKSKRERPLYVAVLKDDLIVVRKLLELYGDDAAREAYQRSRRATPVEVAAGRCNVEMVRLLAGIRPPSPLEEGSGISSESTYNAYLGGALRWAVGATGVDTERITAVTKVLLDCYGTDINFISNYSTPLYAAVRSARPPLVRFLLARGADPNVWNPTITNIPLHAAAQQQNTEIVSLLLDAGADIHARDGYEAGVLLQAFRYAGTGTKSADSTLRICRLLIARGAPVHQWNSMRVTPLHRACSGSMTANSNMSDNRRLVELLLQSGADASVDWEDNMGRTPVDVAMASVQFEGALGKDVVRDLLLPLVRREGRRRRVESWLSDAAAQ
ncbi:Ankyrin repeat protein [Mycena kentingensis (nom. inval.)]|nr:Ankyrin repeat protein [Mycena kentingensis (nom. inval.)]